MSRESLIDRWRNRPAHERWLIGAPVVALALAALYIGVIEPIDASAARLERAMPAIAARHARLRAEAADVRAHPVATSASVAKGGNTTAMMKVVQSTVDRHALRAASPTLERADDSRVRLAFARVPFHAVWPLFQDLQAQFGIRVVALSVDRIDASLARIEATLASGESR